MAPQNLLGLEFLRYFSYVVQTKRLTGTATAEDDLPKTTLPGTLVCRLLWTGIAPEGVRVDFALYTQGSEEVNFCS